MNVGAWDALYAVHIDSHFMRHSLLQRLTGLLLLAAHAIVGTSVLPALTTLAADIEGSHAVMVSQGELGTQVVLQHRDQVYTPNVADHDDAMTRMIVRMCRSTEEGDHKLSSHSLSSGLAGEKENLARSKRQAADSEFIVRPRMADLMALLKTSFTGTDIPRSHSVRLHSIRRMLGTVRLMV